MVEVLTFAVRVKGQSWPLEIGKNDYVSTVIEELESVYNLPRGYRIFHLNPPTLSSEWDGEKGPEVDPQEPLRSVIKGPFDPNSVALIVESPDKNMLELADSASELESAIFDTPDMRDFVKELDLTDLMILVEVSSIFIQGGLHSNHVHRSLSWLQLLAMASSTT